MSDLASASQSKHTLSVVALLLRIGLGLVWLWSAFVSEFVASREVSLGLLSAVGISGDLAPLFLHGASLLDLAFGVATLLGILTRYLAWAQVAVIVIYTLLLVGHVPDLWVHPFAPIGKNIALIAAALALSITRGGHWSMDEWLAQRRNP